MVNEKGDETNMVAKQDVSVTSPHRKCFVAAIICDVFLVNLYLHSLLWKWLGHIAWTIFLCLNLK